MRYLVVVEEGGNSFAAYVPDLPGCIASGESREEVLSLIREMMELQLEEMRQSGEPAPQPSSSFELLEVAAG